METTPPTYAAVAIGEGQLRLSTIPGVALAESTELAVHVGGTEGNVLGLLSRLGHRTAMITALPTGPLGQRVASQYREAGIDIEHVIWRESGRMGLYFHDQASAPVPGQVIYDREGSCFANLRVEDIDWDVIADARLIHSSGITAALNPGTYELVRTAVDVARSRNRVVSVDVNHRSRLWESSTARERLTPLLADADIVFCSCRDARLVFDLDRPGVETAVALSERFGVRTVLVSNGSGPVAVAHDGRSYAAEVPTTTIVDRVGAGDAFYGAFLHGWLAGDVEHGLQLAVAAACLALTRHGDQLTTTPEELEVLARGLGSAPDILR